MNNNKVTDISCKITGIPFVGENGYFICKARALIEKKMHNISIKGILPTPSKGSVLVVSGILSKSDKYGYCIDVTEARSEIDEESALTCWMQDYSRLWKAFCQCLIIFLIDSLL